MHTTTGTGITISALRTDGIDPTNLTLQAMNRLVDTINDNYWFDDMLPIEERGYNNKYMLDLVCHIIELGLGLNLGRPADQIPLFTAGPAQVCLPVSAGQDADQYSIAVRASVEAGPARARISCQVSDIDTLLARGGYTPDANYESITLQHILDGVAGLLTDALYQILDSVNRTPTDED